MTPAELSEYHEKGYIALRRVFPAVEMDAVRKELERVWEDSHRVLAEDDLRVQKRPHTSGGEIIDRFDPISDLSPLLRSLLTDERLLAPLRQIFAGDVMPFKDKFIYKASGTQGYKIHQDYTYWLELPAPPEALLTAVVAVDAADAENGALEFYPGMHRGHLRSNETPKDIFNPEKGLLPAELLEGRTAEMITVDPGDVIVFGSLVPHQSGINHSNRSRRFLFYSYSAASYGDLREIYYRNLYDYLRKDRASVGDAAEKT